MPVCRALTLAWLQVRFAALLAATMLLLAPPASAQSAPAHPFLTLGSTPGELGGRVACYYLQTAPGQHWDIRLTGNFDTYLSIGRGARCDAIAVDLRNDDADGTLNSRLRFTAAGGAYIVRVTGYMGGRGQFQLHVAPGSAGAAMLQAGVSIAGAPAPLSQQVMMASQPAIPSFGDTNGGSVARASYLGVSSQTFTAQMAEAFGLNMAGGTLVNAVTRGSPADQAGLRRGDIILAIDGNATTSAQALTDYVAERSPGTRATLEVSRDGAMGRVLVSLAAPPAEPERQTSRAIVRSTFGQGAAASSAPLNVAGMTVVSVVPSQVTFGSETDTVGTIVDAVAPGSEAAQVGLARGDVIVRVNNGGVTSPAELQSRLRAAAAAGRSNALLSVLRGDAISSLALPIAAVSAQLLAAPATALAESAPAIQRVPVFTSPSVAPAVAMPGGPLSGRRFALVIGNSFYGPSIGSLPNASGDADLIASALREVGFDVEILKNGDQRTMRRAILRLGERIAAGGAGSTGLFFYAGHGMQSRGTNYLIPVGADISSEAELEFEGVPADAVLRQMEDARAATNIVILDACRNMPLARGFRSGIRGLARMDAPRGSFIAYSTAPGDVAVDGAGANSPFALALAQRIALPREQIEATFREVRRTVLTATNGAQTPWDSSSLVEPFAFRP